MPLARHHELLRRVGASAVLLAAATGLSYLLPHRLLAVPATLYFLATLGVTRLLGGWAGLGAALVSVTLLLYWFVPPTGTLEVDAQSATLLLVYLASVAVGTVMLDQPRRAEQRARLEADRMAILQALTSALAQATTRAEVGVAALDAVSRMYDVRSAFLAVVVPGGGELEIVADRGLPQAVTARWRRIPLDSETAVADAIRDRQPVLLRTLDERQHRYPSAAAERELIGGGGAMALPLMLGSEPLGAVGVTLAGSERFGAGNQRFHEAVTLQLAQALQRVALLEVDRQSVDRLQFLAEASEVLSESLVEEETLDKVAHLAVPRFADWATVELVDPDGTPRLVAVAHRDPEMARWARDLREANPPDMSAATGLPNVLRSGQPELYEDIPDSLLDRIGVDSEGRDLVRRLQLRSVILVPLTRREKVLGVITFVQSESGRHYDRTDLEVAEDLGRRAATALENARLYEAEHRARERLAVVSQASRILAGSLDYQETLDHVARLAVNHLADEAVVFVAREGGEGFRVGAVAHRDPAERDALGRVAEWYAGGRPARRTPLARAARTNTIQQVEPLTDEAIAEAAGQDRTLAGDLHRVRAGYAAMVPLIIRNRVQAVLFLGRTAMEGALDGDDQALVEEVARRMARAIENARLYRERDEIAEALQRNLLPTVENPPGLDLALTYVSSAEGAEVGGDFFDLFALDDGDWLAAIGDVCGKGIEAAALMGIARHTLRAVALPDRSPDRILAALNRALVAQYEDQRFCTVCCARIRIGDRGLTAEVASGGHPLPVILRRDGTVEHAGLHGGLLGVFPNPELACTTVRLEPGDLLVLYTDGIEQPGATAEERVLDVVGRMAGAGPQDVIDALVAEYRKDHRRSDDFAAMAFGLPGDGPSS